MKEQVYLEAKNFSDRLLKVHSADCVAGLYCDLLGGQGFRYARKLYENGDKIQYNEVKNYFREGLGGFLKLSGSGRHIMNRPFGYPGDFQILEQVYDCHCSPATTDARGAQVDKWGLANGLPKAVINRKNALRVYLENKIASSDKKLSLLSIASGSARELRELDEGLFSNLNVTLVDFDQKAMDFAVKELTSRPTQLELKSFVGDAVKGGDFLAQLNKPHDIIYSFGLFDYLPDKLVIKCIHNFKKLLTPESEFIFCLKDHRYYDAFFYDFFHDWKFVHRIGEDGHLLAEEAGLRVEKELITDGQVIWIYICKLI